MSLIALQKVIDGPTDGVPIIELELYIRSINALTAVGILTIEQLVQCTPRMIMKIPNAGKVTLANIQTELASMRGLYLAEENV